MTSVLWTFNAGMEKLEGKEQEFRFERGESIEQIRLNNRGGHLNCDKNQTEVIWEVSSKPYHVQITR